MMNQLRQGLISTLAFIAFCSFAGADQAVDSQQRLQSPGHKLFIQHCAGCHGETGDGQGIAARFVFPKPRNFQTGKYKLVSTENSVPSEADLEGVLVRGMPGSSMPSWAHLSAADRKLLIAEVYRLTSEGARQRYIKSLIDEQGLTQEDLKATDVQEEIVAFAKNKTTPSEAAVVPQIPAPDASAVARGKEHFIKAGCASCHGNEGKGDGVKEMIDDDGFATRPRDLTRGIYKGGHDPASLFLRIARGMPGTPMPSAPTLTEPQVIDLIHFLRSLSTEEQRQAAILKRQAVVAKRVGTLPATSDAALWRESPAVRLNLVPLWWRDDAVASVQVQAVHDGKDLALRLEWADPTADLHAGKVEAFKDAAAMQLAPGGNEPFLGMGLTQSPIDLWLWDADRGRTGGQVEDVNPRVVVDIYPFTEKTVETAEYSRPGTLTAAQADVALPAQAVGNLIARSMTHPSGASSLTAGGPGSATFLSAKSQLVSASGQWHQGQWVVLMRRTLNVGGNENGVSLAPGAKASAAFAIWEGSHRDRNGQKQVTVWHDLELEDRR
jgi:mono/diheme cytochrome c family protein